jgi:hypothetical protein
LSDSTPSISDRNWATTVASMSDEMPEPRMRNSESISSKKITTGTSSLALSRAFLNTSRSLCSVSPTYLLRSSGPFTFRKYASVSLPVRSSILLARLLATAFAISVLPQPGGP